MLKTLVRQSFRLQPIFTARLSIPLCNHLHTLSNHLNKYSKNEVNNCKQKTKFCFIL